MIPDVTPNGVFYLPPTGWLTSFYNPPKEDTEEEITLRMKAGLLMYRVLVADNYPIIRMAVKNLVEQLDNFKVIAEEATGIDASLRAEQGDIDIIIMDLAMPPGENGLITIKRIHEHFPNTKIINVISMSKKLP